MSKFKLPLSFAVLAFAACATDEPTISPPGAAALPATRTESVADDYHGTAVADPYRWLEDQDSPETAAWARAQSAVTESFLAALPQRAELRQRLTALWNYERFEPPSRHGEWWLYRKNDGLQEQAVIYRTRSLDEPGEVLLDPNAMSADGTVSVGAFVPSVDGTLAAYAVSGAGSDWIEWHVMEIATGAVRGDLLRWSKFGGVAWTHDNGGFFYTRYPAPAAGEVYQAVNERPELCYHELGTLQAADRVMYSRPDQPRWGFSGRVTDDGRYLVVAISEGTDRRSRVAYADLEASEPQVQPLLMDFDAEYRFAGSVGPRFYFYTDLDAPTGKLISLSLDRPAKTDWTEVIGAREATLSSVQLIGGRFVATYTEDAQHVVALSALDGKPEKELPLPPLGSVGGFTGKQADRQTFFAYSSFTTPETVYGYDFDRGELSVWRQPDLALDSSGLETRQVFYQGRDGARVPMSLVYRKGMVLDGRTPTLLYGYGGFNISLLPRFSVQTAVWVERGGLFAQANLRGGGEYGEEWHRAGMLEHKQNVFDDFLGAAQYLIRNDYTQPAKLAIWGRSNGGLLVGACLTQRPDLFGAALPEVGVLDMLRYHRFTIGWAWAPEYGSSDDAEQFATLHAYSPLHRIQPGTAYPATLVMTGDHDDRVLPGHSYKFAAALQAAQAGDAPILLRVETRAGHGQKTPTSKLIEAAADRLAFLEWALRAR